MKSLRKLLWIQLFLLSVLGTASALVEFAPASNAGDQMVAEEITNTVSSH